MSQASIPKRFGTGFRVSAGDAVIKAAQLDGERGRLWGYAAVAGNVDLAGDVIQPDALREAAWKFLQDYYAEAASIKVNHQQPAKAVLIESSFHQLGPYLGWWVGVQLLDEELRQMAREGKVYGFSIGGSGTVVTEEDQAGG
jgi:GNAT superfamily N-acetyltransferase